jgi:hypothetical protein
MPRRKDQRQEQKEQNNVYEEKPEKVAQVIAEFCKK